MKAVRWRSKISNLNSRKTDKRNEIRDGSYKEAREI